MSHDHSHHKGHGHSHSHGYDAGHAGARGLGWAALLTGGFMIAEAVAGVISGSLALIADAGHMLADAACIACASRRRCWVGRCWWWRSWASP